MPDSDHSPGILASFPILGHVLGASMERGWVILGVLYRRTTQKRAKLVRVCLFSEWYSTTCILGRSRF
jgi:hypothetical protein